MILTAVRASWRSMFAFTTTRHLRTLIPAWIFATAAGAITPIVSIFLGFIFDVIAQYVAGSVGHAAFMREVSKWCVILVGLGVASWILNSAFFALWVTFGEIQAKNVREKMFAGLLKRDMEWYDLRKDGVASLLVRIQTQVRDLQIATSQPLGLFIKDIAAAFAAVSIALYYSWKLTLVLSTSIPIAAGVLLLISRRLQPAIEAQRRQLNQASQFANAAINAIDTVKVFNGQDHEVRQYVAAIKTAAKSYLVQANTSALQMGFSQFLLVAMFMAGFWYGLVLYNEGGLTPGSVLTTFYAYLMANLAVESLLPQWLVLSKGMSAGEALKQIIGEINDERGMAKITGSRWPETCAGDVEISNVTFAYPSNPTQPALTNVNFFFPAGETTFLFGRSGSGKSTLSNLLLRFYALTSGSIAIDSQPIEVLDEKWLRHNVTLVQQQSVLFNETLFQNVAFGRQNGEAVTRNDVQQACQMAMLSEVIQDLPQGLDTIIGSSGDTLSGGQKQRVAIARAILRDSPILILDEVTSALDHANRTLVMEAIREWRMGKTTIIITHDASQIHDKDFVYVMDHSRVVEEGYRKALEKNPFGLFASLVNDQGDAKDSEAEPVAMSPVTEEGGLITPTARDHEGSPFSVMESLASLEDAESKTSNTERMSRIRRLSSFFIDNPDTNPQAYRHSKRASLRMPSTYANTMRADNALRRLSDPSSHSRRFSVNLQIPLPSLPAPGYKRRSLRPLSHYSQIDMESYQITQPAPDNSVGRPVGAVRQLSPERSGESRLNEEYLALVSGQTARDKKRKKQSQEQKPASLTTIFTTVWPSLPRRDRVKLILGFVFVLINAGCNPAFSYILAKLLNTFYIPSNQAAEARKYALIILGLALIEGLSSYTFHYLLEVCGRTWVDALRHSAFSRILAQPRAWFDDPAHAPHILADILDRNAEEMRNLLGRFAGYAFLAGSMVFIAVLWAFIVCWKLTLVGLAAAPAMYLLTRVFERVSAAWERRTDAHTAAISAVYTETFAHIRVVRAMTLETHFQTKHGRAVQAAYRIGLRRGVFTGMLFGISDASTLFLTALIFYYGALLVNSGAFAFESVIACVTLLLFGIGSANDTLALIPQISAARATATALLHLSSLNLPSETGTQTLASPLPIRLHNLSFAYPLHPTNHVLRNVSLIFHARTCTAIVGPSGSGKSTLAALLLGLYLPSPSTSSTPPLTFGHVALPSLSLARLRAHMALVPQFPILFPASVAANIVYGLSPSSPLTSRDSVVRAARQAGIHDFVASLPQGYETRIGEGGVALSGGQMMRVAIARALVRGPRVLVLDEPTAGLDGEAAEGVAGAIGGLVEEGSEVAVVVVTHDVRLMRRAGRVVVLERGVVVEEGGWEELRWRGGALSRLMGSSEVR